MRRKKSLIKLMLRFLTVPLNITFRIIKSIAHKINSAGRVIRCHSCNNKRDFKARLLRGLPRTTFRMIIFYGFWLTFLGITILIIDYTPAMLIIGILFISHVHNRGYWGRCLSCRNIYCPSCWKVKKSRLYCNHCDRRLRKI